MNKKLLPICIISVLFLTTVLVTPVSSYSNSGVNDDFSMPEEINHDQDYENSGEFVEDTDYRTPEDLNENPEDLIVEHDYDDFEEIIENSDYINQDDLIEDNGGFIDNHDSDLTGDADILTSDRDLSGIREGPTIGVSEWEFDWREPYDIVVITTKSMSNTEPLKRFVAAKAILQGLKVKIKSVEDIYQDYRYRFAYNEQYEDIVADAEHLYNLIVRDHPEFSDLWTFEDFLETKVGCYTAENWTKEVAKYPEYGTVSIHKFLFDQWENCGITYCLLVGDDSKTTRIQMYGMGSMGRYNTGWHYIEPYGGSFNVKDPVEIPTQTAHLFSNCLDGGDVYCSSDWDYAFLDEKGHGKCWTQYGTDDGGNNVPLISGGLTRYRPDGSVSETYYRVLQPCMNGLYNFESDIYVGRAPIDNYEDLDNFVDKTLCFMAGNGGVSYDENLLKSQLQDFESLVDVVDYDSEANDNSVSDVYKYLTAEEEDYPYVDYIESNVLPLLEFAVDPDQKEKEKQKLDENGSYTLLETLDSNVTRVLDEIYDEFNGAQNVLLVGDNNARGDAGSEVLDKIVEGYPKSFAVGHNPAGCMNNSRIKGDLCSACWKTGAVNCDIEEGGWCWLAMQPDPFPGDKDHSEGDWYVYERNMIKGIPLASNLYKYLRGTEKSYSYHCYDSDENDSQNDTCYIAKKKVKIPTFFDFRDKMQIVTADEPGVDDDDAMDFVEMGGVILPAGPDGHDRILPPYEELDDPVETNRGVPVGYNVDTFYEDHLADVRHLEESDDPNIWNTVVNNFQSDYNDLENEWTKDDIIDSINSNKYDLIVSHGYADSFMNMKIDAADVPSLTNNDKFPIIFSPSGYWGGIHMGGSTNDMYYTIFEEYMRLGGAPDLMHGESYTYNIGKGRKTLVLPDCLAEELVNSEHGPVACIANSFDDWGSDSPWVTGDSAIEIYTRAFINEIFGENADTLGQALFDSKAKALRDHYGYVVYITSFQYGYENSAFGTLTTVIGGCGRNWAYMGGNYYSDAGPPDGNCPIKWYRDQLNLLGDPSLPLSLLRKDVVNDYPFKAVPYDHAQEYSMQYSENTSLYNNVLKVLVGDPDGDPVDVTLFVDGVKYDVITGVRAGSVLEIPVGSLGLTDDNTHYWYVVVSDGRYKTISDTWSFTTRPLEEENLYVNTLSVDSNTLLEFVKHLDHRSDRIMKLNGELFCGAVDDIVVFDILVDKPETPYEDQTVVSNDKTQNIGSSPSVPVSVDNVVIDICLPDNLEYYPVPDPGVDEIYESINVDVREIFPGEIIWSPDTVTDPSEDDGEPRLSSAIGNVISVGGGPMLGHEPLLDGNILTWNLGTMYSDQSYHLVFLAKAVETGVDKAYTRVTYSLPPQDLDFIQDPSCFSDTIPAMPVMMVYYDFNPVRIASHEEYWKWDEIYEKWLNTQYPNVPFEDSLDYKDIPNSVVNTPPLKPDKPIGLSMVDGQSYIFGLRALDPDEHLYNMVMFEVDWGDGTGTSTFTFDNMFMTSFGCYNTPGGFVTVSHMYTMLGNYGVRYRAFDGMEWSEWSDPLRVSVVIPEDNLFEDIYLSRGDFFVPVYGHDFELVDDPYLDPVRLPDGDEPSTSLPTNNEVDYDNTIVELPDDPIILPEEDDKIPDTYKAEPEEEENNDQGDSQAEKSAFLRMLDRFLVIFRRLLRQD